MSVSQQPFVTHSQLCNPISTFICLFMKNLQYQYSETIHFIFINSRKIQPTLHIAQPCLKKSWNIAPQGHSPRFFKIWTMFTSLFSPHWWSFFVFLFIRPLIWRTVLLITTWKINTRQQPIQALTAVTWWESPPMGGPGVIIKAEKRPSANQPSISSLSGQWGREKSGDIGGDTWGRR